jgi:hypothetical protein
MTVYFFEDLLHLLTAAPRPTLPTWSVQRVGSYLRYSGRDANVTSTAARDPKVSSAGLKGVIPPCPLDPADDLDLQMRMGAADRAEAPLDRLIA